MDRSHRSDGAGCLVLLTQRPDTPRAPLDVRRVETRECAIIRSFLSDTSRNGPNPHLRAESPFSSCVPSPQSRLVPRSEDRSTGSSRRLS